ncbi:MAG: response regulator transcription factor [Treponema sp.]|nr:response regulator transcription factor [Treponema sp.]
MISIVIICEKKEEQEQIIQLLSAYKDLRIVSAGKDGYDALISAEHLQPDIIIMDMHMSGINAPELTPMIKRKSPLTTLIALSSHEGAEYACMAIKAGISGYLLKEADMDILPNTISIISHGGCYISKSIIRQVFNAVPDKIPETSKKGRGYATSNFSSTERCIFTGIAQGYSDEEIADNLHISPGTVRNYMSMAKRRTGLKNRTQLVLEALMCEMIHLPDIAPLSLKKIMR